jgi:hypothetical protein
MTVFEVLKQAGRIVTSLIGEKTPPIFDTLRKVYADLGDLVACVKQVDGLTPEIARGVNALVERLEVFKASHNPLEAGADKAFTLEEFVTYFKEQIEKGIGEPPGRSLMRLHALSAGIAKALGDQYAGPGDNPSINMRVFVDPWQQASVEREGDGAAKTTSGTAQQGEVKATPGISVSDVMKEVAKTVDKAAVTPFVIDVGWANDLTSKEFLRGERTWDWGRDGQKD